MPPTEADRGAFMARCAIVGASAFCAAVCRAFAMAITVFEVMDGDGDGMNPYQPAITSRKNPTSWWATWSHVSMKSLVGDDWNHGILWPSIYREFHNPNWRTHIFQRGWYTTNQIGMGISWEFNGNIHHYPRKWRILSQVITKAIDGNTTKFYYIGIY